MQTLPIAPLLSPIVKTLKDHNQLIIHAQTGAGKSTALPLSLLNAPWRKRKILLLEPRRLAARRVAERMAEVLGEPLGERVGYRIRHEVCIGSRTIIEVVTEGIVTRILQEDPELSAYDVVLFDEFHERSLHGDLALSLALQSQQFLREDLRLVLMSATLDKGALEAFLEDAITFTSEGRSYPITTHYLPYHKHYDDLLEGVYRTLLDVLEHQRGNVLVFLAGAREINTLQRRIESRFKEDPHLCIAPLYGALARSEQERAIAPTPKGLRKIVLATNIAETSLTIEGISIVIDSGMERRITFHGPSGFNKLITAPIARDSATQRAGRAGRIEAGVCYRMWHESEHTTRLLTTPPEITRSDLTPLMLELALWGAKDPDELSWLTSPDPHNITHAKTLLKTLGALDHEDKITPHGRAMVSLPLHPRLAHMLLLADRKGALAEGCLCAVALTNPHNLHKSTGLLDSIDALHTLATKNPKDPLIKELNTLYRRFTNNPFPHEHYDDKVISSLIALAYPDRIAQRRLGNLETANKGKYLLSNGKGATLNTHATLHHHSYLICPEVDGEGRILKAIPIEKSTLLTLFESTLQNEEQCFLEADSGRIVRHKVLALGALILYKHPLPLQPNEQTYQLLIKTLLKEGLTLLEWSETARQFQSRITLIHTHSPESVRDMSDASLLKEIEGWLGPYLISITHLEALKQIDLLKALEGWLSWEEKTRCDTLAPTHYILPSKRRVRIDYTTTPPSIACKLQELFGLTDTPTLFQNAIPLSLHLLSPAGRPIQVTQNIKGFWEGSYHEIKKELKGRYPKHPWPEDPLQATPTAKSKKALAKEGY